MKRIAFIMIAVFAFATVSLSADRNFVLVIDAGHGGHDHGAPGAISKEKNLTLRFALAFGKMVERHCPDVKVIYTRTTDRFLELWQRAEIANKNKADLFISVHINALAGGRIARGFQTYTLGQGRSGVGIIKNLDVAKRENSVILLEKDYKQTYQGFDNSAESNIMFEFMQDQNMERSVDLAKMMQRNVCAATGRQDMGAHQDNLAVLRLTSMPGCLVELGFISTPDEERFMNSEEATERYAKGLFNAFVQYKNKYYGGSTQLFTVEAPKKEPVAVAEPPSQPQKTERQVAPVESKQTTAEPLKTKKREADEEPVKAKEKSNEPVFKVQIVASSKTLPKNSPQLKGEEDVDSYVEDGMVKYTIGSSNDYNEIYRLRKSLLEKFPQAFIIAFKNGRKMDVNQAIREFKTNRK